jgi:hypothetical protein
LSGVFRRAGQLIIDLGTGKRRLSNEPRDLRPVKAGWRATSV